MNWKTPPDTKMCPLGWHFGDDCDCSGEFVWTYIDFEHDARKRQEYFAKITGEMAESGRTQRFAKS